MSCCPTYVPAAVRQSSPKHRPLTLVFLATLIGLLLPASLPAATPGDWTVVVYGVADNDLEVDFLDDLGEMLAVKTPGLRFVILADRLAGSKVSAPGGLGSWTTAKRILVENGQARVLEDLGEVDCTQPQVLENHVAASLREYPARHTMMVLWDHGGGWSVFASDESNPQGGLTLPAIRQALGAALARTKTKSFDVLGFDACLMGNYETVRQLGDLASSFVASQELAPSHGWDYRVLAGLSAQSTGIQAATLLARGFLAQGQSLGTQDSITASVIDTKALGALDRALEGFAQALEGQAPDLAGQMTQQTRRVLHFGKSAREDQDAWLYDMGQLVASLADLDPSLTQSAAAVTRALKAAVVFQANGQAYRQASGLSIYFPSRQAYLDPGYDTVAPPAWLSMLQTRFDQSRAKALTLKTRQGFGFRDQALSIKADEGFQVISASIDPALAETIDSATLYWSLETENGSLALGSQSGWLEDDSRIEAWWYPEVLILTQGSKESLVYAELDDADEENLEWSVTLAWYPAGAKVPDQVDEADLVYLLAVTDAEGQVKSTRFYRESANGAWGEFKPRRGGILVPVHLVWTEEEQFLLSGEIRFQADSPLDLAYEDLQPGSSIQFELWISDAEGQEASLQETLVLP